MSYSATVLSDTPAGYWRLDDTNTTLADSSGNGHNGTYSGSYTQGVTGLIAGDADTAVTFGSAGTDFASASIPSIGTGDFSLECWVKSPSNGSTAVMLGFQGAWFGMISHQANWFTALTGGPAIDDNSPHHVAVTRSSGTLTLYVDGSSVGTTSDSNSLSGPLYINGIFGGGFAFGATIDEVAVYTHALTSSRVLAHYDSGHGAASQLTLTGPTSGTVGVASSNFTVTPDGTVSSDTVTPHTSGSGTFTPSSLTFTSSGTPQTFTYTPSTTAGSPHAISITDTASLTIVGSPINYTVTGGSVTIPVTDANWFFSPYNWRLSGSTYAQTNNPGAYFKIDFTGTSCALLLDTSPNSGESSGNYPAVSWSVDNAVWQRSQLTSGQTALTLATGLASGTHTLELWVVAAWWQDDRWTTPQSVVRVTGLQVDSGAASAAPSGLQSGRMILYWDSNGEGYEALGATVNITLQDAQRSASALIGRALGCEVGIIAFAGQGYDAPGGGNVPAVTSAWDHYDSTHSRLVSSAFSPAPDWIVSLHGENGGTTGLGTLLAAWRAAAPSAKMAICAAANLANAAAVQSAVTTFADSNCKFISTGQNWLGAASGALAYSNDLHLNGSYGHPRYGAAIAAGIESAFATASGAVFSPIGCAFIRGVS